MLQQQQPGLELLLAGPVLGQQPLDVRVAHLQLLVWVVDAKQPAVPGRVACWLL